MTIMHHPPEDLLGDFAAGKLDQAQHLVIAVHATQCERCHLFIKAIEVRAGRAIEDVVPVAMSADAFDTVIARIEATPDLRKMSKPLPASVGPSDEGEDLPEIVRSLPLGKWRTVAPGVSLRPILIPSTDRARAFLLRSAAGTRMLEHTHVGSELTCVLKGSFSHEGGRYSPGDFDFGNEDVDHQPIVGSEGPCLCIVAMTGKLRMNGLLGRLIN